MQRRTRALTALSAGISLLCAASFADAQGIRSGRSLGGGFGAGPAGPTIRMAPAPVRGPAIAPAPGVAPSFQPGPSLGQTHSVPSTLGVPVKPALPRARSTLSGSIWAPQIDLRGRPPHHHHHHHHFPESRGVIVFGLPFVSESIVVTQVAPGVLHQERRRVEEVPPLDSSREGASLAPFDPTPQEVVDRMLALAAIKKGDVIYDLGSGDARVLIRAAKKYGIRGVGFELDPGLVKLARENVRNAGVEKLVEIREQDFLGADLSPASVVTVYLSYDGNLAIREQLRRQLRAGARIVSYTFDMGDWPPKIAESYRDTTGNVHALYLWVITSPAAVSRGAEPMLTPQPNRAGPLIVEVR
jgi:hypothetical protein